MTERGTQGRPIGKWHLTVAIHTFLFLLYPGSTCSGLGTRTTSHRMFGDEINFTNRYGMEPSPR